jgi:phosphoribosyl-ATP pyrophosphohydrolase
MADRKEADAHLSMLRTLCEQADALRKVAEELCERLTKQMEETRARLVHRPPPVERRRRSSNKAR